MFVPMLIAVASLIGAAPSGHTPPPPAAPTEQAAPAFPATPAGRVAEAWVAAFNGGEDAMRAFIAARIPAADLARRPVTERLERYRQLRGDLGALTVLQIQRTTPTQLVFVARGAGQQRVEFTVDAAAGTPDQMVNVRGDLLGGPEDDAPPEPDAGVPMTAAALRDSLDRLIDAEFAADRFSGTALLVRSGEPVYARAVGLADRERGWKNRMDTKYNLGSINKAFTMVAIAQLAARGKLSLSDPIEKLLPDHPVPAARKVTIEQLVRHRSGMGDIFGARYDKMDRSTLRNLRDWLPLFADQPLEFEPGARMRYSNAGFVLLGLVIEKVSGMNYYDYIRRFVYEPAGMKDTDSYANDERVSSVAKGYTRDRGGPEMPLHDNAGTRPMRGSSAGGGYATAEDLARFADGLLSGSFLTPGWSRWVMGGPAPSGAEAGATPAGAGWGVAGGAPGVNALLDFDDATTLVMLANMDPPVVERMSRKVRGWLRRTTF